MNKQDDDKELDEKIQEIKDNPDLRAIKDLKMGIEQMDDVAMPQQLEMPESVMEKVHGILEAKARDAGYESMEAYCEAHPEGMDLLTDGEPITLDLSEAEQDEMKANEALQKQSTEGDREKFLGCYEFNALHLACVNSGYGDLVTIDPEIMNGKPCVKDSRVPVDMILGLLKEKRDDGRYNSIEDIIDEYDFLDARDVANAIEFSTYCVRPKVLAEVMVEMHLGADEEEEDDGEAT
jgi:uncharacterized protein (DUF433 family)